MRIILGLRVASQGKFEHMSWWIYLGYHNIFKAIAQSHCSWIHILKPLPMYLTKSDVSRDRKVCIEWTIHIIKESSYRNRKAN